jgi:multidrug efflux system membrane fusion protein
MASSLTYEGGHATIEKPRPGRTRLVIGLVLMALLLALLGGGLWGFNRMREQGIAAYFASQVPPPTPVAAAPAEQGPMPRWLEGIGSIAAVHQVMVSAEVAGRVTDIMFRPGSSVKAGDPLIQLNDAPERAQIASYEAQARLAESNLQRANTLVKRDFGTQASVDQYQAELDQARAGILQSRAVVAQKLIKAPFAGKLGIRQVELGQQVSPGETLVTLTDLDELYVNFTLPEQTRGELQLGATVEVRVDAWPGRVFEAKLTTIEPQVDPATRTIQLQATLPNPEGALVPGMFANARLVLPPAPDVVTVPETAVTQTLYGDSVFVVKEEKGPDGKPVQKAAQVFVKTGSVHDGRIAITEGVAAGDQVVASGQLKLQNGAPVQITSDTALTIPAQPPVQ